VSGVQRGVRGNLTLELVRVLDAIDDARWKAGLADCCNLVWENVPGVLSTRDNAFGCLIAALVGAQDAVAPFGKRGKWPRAGLVRGPRRSAAWRILDAQYFGVAQRRRRVFLVAGAGSWFDPAAVLLESDGMRRDSAPSREARQKVAGSVAANTGGCDENDAKDNRLIAVATALRARDISRGVDSDCTDTLVPVDPISFDWQAGDGGNDKSFRGKSRSYIVDRPGVTRALSYCKTLAIAYGGNNQSGPIPVATARSAHGGPHGRLDFETETFLVQCNGTNVGVETDISGTLREGNHNVTAGWPCVVTGGDVTHSLNTANNGKHCSEDGTGRGVPIIAFDSRQDTVHSVDSFGSLGSSSPQSQAIAFQTSQSGTRTGDTHATLDSNNGSRRHNGVLTNSMQVRRLTVTECERLQGLPDGYTMIRDPRTRKKLEADYLAYLQRHHPNLDPKDAETMAKDGPRYRAIGNGMAVPCVAWILERLDRHMKGEL
jgi:DNA (cytosine-5)-methyltransferase 1